MGLKLAILGASGLLGRDLAVAFSEFDPIHWGRREGVDVTDRASLERAFQNPLLTHVIHLAAMTDVDECQRYPERAEAVHIRGMENLIAVLQAQAVPPVVVYVSTEQVFSGLKPSYTEFDEPDVEREKNVYGWTKAEAERLLRASGLPYLIIRTSWLFGAGRENFVSWLTKKIQETSGKAVLSVNNDCFGKPTYTVDLAKALFKLLTGPGPFLPRMYHLVNEESGEAGGSRGVTKAAVAAYLVELLERRSEIRIEGISSAKTGWLAKRPKFGVLRSTRFPRMRNWRDAMREYLRFHLGWSPVKQIRSRHL